MLGWLRSCSHDCLILVYVLIQTRGCQKSVKKIIRQLPFKVLVASKIEAFVFIGSE